MQPSNWASSHTCYALGRRSRDATLQVEGQGHHSVAGWNLAELDQEGHLISDQQLPVEGALSSS